MSEAKQVEDEKSVGEKRAVADEPQQPKADVDYDPAVEPPPAFRPTKCARTKPAAPATTRQTTLDAEQPKQKRKADDAADESPPPAKRAGPRKTIPDVKQAKRKAADDDNGDDGDPADAETPARKKAAVAPAPNETLQQQLLLDVQQQARPPPPKPQPVAGAAERDPHMFYPDTYDSFDESKLVCEGEPKKAAVGGGYMFFLSYIWPDGMSKSLCAQAPKMFLPSGVREFTDEGKTRTVALASFGRDWEKNEQLVRWRHFTERVEAGIVRIIVAKGLGLPFYTKEEEVRLALTPIVNEAVSEDPNKPGIFPPAMRLSVNTSPNNRSMLVTQMPLPDGTSVYSEVAPASVTRGGTMVPMTQFQWGFRKKKSNPAGYTYSVHCSVYQAVVEQSAGLGSGATSSLKIIL